MSVWKRVPERSGSPVKTLESDGFEGECRSIAEGLGLSVTIIHGAPAQLPTVEAGVLSIVRRGVRAAFTVGSADTSADEQNKNTEGVLRALKMEGRLAVDSFRERVMR